DEDVSRGSDVIVPDRKRIGRLAPLRLREDQRGRVLPVPQHRPQRREQRLVHRVADQQRVHVGASRDVGPAGRRAVEEQRHESATEDGVQSRRKNVRRDRLGHRQKLPPAPPPLKPPPPPKPPNPPPKPPPPPPPPPHPPPPPDGVQPRRKNARRDRLGHRQKLPPAPPPLKPPPPPKPPNPPPKPPPPPPPPPPRPPPHPPPIHSHRQPSRRCRARVARVAMITSTMARMNTHFASWPTSSAGCSGGAGACSLTSVTPNSSAKACARSATPSSRPPE